jgi:hypothetical protein
MQMKKLAYSINCKKIDKEILKVTDNGIWLNGTIYLQQTVDQYGNIGFITERPKEGKQATILGQLKIVEEKKLEQNDLPF